MEAPLRTLLQASESTDLTYRPVIFSLPKDEIALRTLLTARPGIRISDRLPAQLRELLKALNPTIKFTESSLQDAVNKHIIDSELCNYGSWVFYPWSNHLIHLLGAEEFALVRTDRNRNKITKEEQAILALKKVGVIGLSVGQSVSLTMALERTFGEIRLADFDTLDLSNLNRIRTGVQHLGQNKAIVTAREIAEIDPYLRVICFSDGLTHTNVDRFFTEGGKLDILVEECDSVDIKILARQKAKALGIPVVMDMSDRGCLDVERFDLEPERPVMHGWIDHLDLEAAKRPMSAEEKVPYMLPITGVETLSPRMKASVIELGQTISTWPQLATSVVLGGALAGDTVRRIALDQFRTSGRWHIDLDELVADPVPPTVAHVAGPASFRLNDTDLQKLDRALGQAPPGALELDATVLHKLVEAGGQAPSSGNRQPWKFIWRAGRLCLFQDEERSHSACDPGHLMSWIGLGACAENVVLTAHAHGLAVSVAPIPTDSDSRLAAIFTFFQQEELGTESHTWDALAPMIGKRNTQRSIGSPGQWNPELHDTLLRAVQQGSGCELSISTDKDLITKAALLYAGAERTLWLHPEGHRAHFSMMRWTGEDARQRGDGMELAAFGLPPMAEAALKVMADPRTMTLAKQWGTGGAIGMLPAMAIVQSPALACLAMAGTKAGSFEGGRTLQRIWLSAAISAIGVQPLGAAMELAQLGAADHSGLTQAEKSVAIESERRLKDLFGIKDGHCLLLRLAMAIPAPTSPLRLPYGQILLTLP